MRPVEPGAGEELYRAAVASRVHAVAVEFDLVQRLVALRRRVDELGELRRDPLRQSRRVWTARYRPRHAGSGNRLWRLRMRLLELIHVAAMLAAWANSNMTPSQCRQVGKRLLVLTVAVRAGMRFCRMQPAQGSVRGIVTERPSLFGARYASAGNFPLLGLSACPLV